MENGPKNRRVLASAFGLATVILFLGIALGIYQSLITSHRLPRIRFSYEPYIEQLRDSGDDHRLISQMQLALDLDPSNPVAVHSNLATILTSQGRIDEAIAHYTEALRLKPDLAEVHNNLAWLLATSADSKHRDGKKAVASAWQACELQGWDDFSVLDTLAAAYAENGQFGQAIKWQTRALQLAPAGAKPQLRHRIELYQAGKPYRDAQK